MVETAWLIEMRDTRLGVRYLTLDRNVSEFWTSDVNLALRFCRQQDAQSYVDFWDGEGAVSHPVEHMWPAPPGA